MASKSTTSSPITTSSTPGPSAIPDSSTASPSSHDLSAGGIGVGVGVAAGNGSKPSSSSSSAAAAAAAAATRAFSRTPSSWDPQDDLLLRHLKEQQKLGWKEIAAHFTHRTPNACQFRWRRLRSGVLKNATTNPAASPSLSSSHLSTAAALNGGSGNAAGNNSSNNNSFNGSSGISATGAGATKKGSFSASSSFSHASNNGSGNSTNNNTSNLTGALAGLNALSSGVRTASPVPMTSSFQVSDENYYGGGNNANINSATSNNPSSSLFSSIINTSNKNRSSFGAPANYNQWSFSAVNGNPGAGAGAGGVGGNSNTNYGGATNGIGSPDNDPLSNSISSLNSLDSATSNNKNSFNLYHQDTNLPSSSNSFAQQSFSQGFLNSYSSNVPNDFWRPDEDELLLSKRRRELSLTELSILLPTRSEEDIIARIKELDQLPTIHRTSSGMRGSAATSIYGDNDNNSHSDLANSGTVGPGSAGAGAAAGVAAAGGQGGQGGQASQSSQGGANNNRVNSQQGSGYGLHTLSRTLSASSQISLNSNVSYSNSKINTDSNNNSSNNNNNNNINNSNIVSLKHNSISGPSSSSVPNNSIPISSDLNKTSTPGFGTPIASSNLSLLNTMSTSSSPLPSSKSSPLISARQITDFPSTINGAPSSSGGGMTISSIRRTLSQTSTGSRSGFGNANGISSIANINNGLNSNNNNPNNGVDANPSNAISANGSNASVSAKGSSTATLHNSSISNGQPAEGETNKRSAENDDEAIEDDAVGNHSESRLSMGSENSVVTDADDKD